MEKTSIGIIGQGFVGSAIREGLKKHYDIRTYDLDKSKCNSTHAEVCNQSKVVFVCVPTPDGDSGWSDRTEIFFFVINSSTYNAQFC